MVTMLGVVARDTQPLKVITQVETGALLLDGKQVVVHTLSVQDQQRLVTHSLDGQPMQMELVLLINQMPH
jgi:predicted DNA repair protein MutK